MADAVRSPYGRRFSLPEAAEYLGMTPDALYGLVRQRRITFHRAAAPLRVVTRKGAGGRPVKAVRGGDYFFFETELLAWIESTRVDPVPADVVKTGHHAAWETRSPELAAVLAGVPRFS